jgi:hypothetical protein
MMASFLLIMVVATQGIERSREQRANAAFALANLNGDLRAP